VITAASIEELDPVPLQALIPRVRPFAVSGETGDVLLRDVQFDHRRVQQATRGGDLFCCVPGEHRDGHLYADEALRAGAVAFVCERPLGGAAREAPQLLVGDGGARAPWQKSSSSCGVTATRSVETSPRSR
jgi:UDP-N-acetylmuramyl pentapeptide synthase